MADIVLTDIIDDVFSNTTSCFKVMYNGVKVWERKDWNNIDVEPHDCLTFTTEGSSSIVISLNNEVSGLQYSLDKQEWRGLSNGFSIFISKDNPFYVRGITDTHLHRYEPVIKTSGDPVSVYGNITALVDYTKDPTEVDVCNQAFNMLFKGSNIAKLPTLLMRSAGNSAFGQFAYESSITGSVTVGIETAGYESFHAAFESTNITSAVIKCKDADYYSFWASFMDCKSIKDTSIYADSCKKNSFYYMFGISTLESLTVLVGDGGAEDGSLEDTLCNTPNCTLLRCNCENISTFKNIFYADSNNSIPASGKVIIKQGVEPPPIPDGWTIEYM